MLNHCVIMGRAATDLELKSVPVHDNKERKYVFFNLAVQRNHLNADGSRITDFIHCVAWGSTAEFICKYFSKGRLMIASGELRCRSYLKNDEKRTATELLVTKVDFSGEPKHDGIEEISDEAISDELLSDDGVPF